MSGNDLRHRPGATPVDPSKQEPEAPGLVTSPRDPSQPLRDPMAYVRHERQAAAAQINRSLDGWRKAAGGAPVQRMARSEGAAAPGEVHEAAEAGTRGPGGPLPHLDKIQQSFGAHDVSGIQAHVGGEAAAASQQMGAQAFASGNHVAFAQSSPDLHTAAHEAAHVVQQRGGVQLKSNVGEVGDAHERNADAVADAVVQGKSAEPLLGPKGGAGPAGKGGPVQKLSHTVKGSPPVNIDINTLTEDECKAHLGRMARQANGAATGTDSEYTYAPADKGAIQKRMEDLKEQAAKARLATVVANLTAQLAGLGTAADWATQPPWHGTVPAAADGGETTNPAAVAPDAAVARWQAFLGAGPYSHKHPRTGAVDPSRLVSGDAKRSIRYGNHETGSSPKLHHFHEETWTFASATLTVTNVIRRVPV